MVFQARKWGWKRIAARLLLVPVLAGGSAATAQQPRAGMTPAAGTPVGQTRPAAPGAKPAEPKGLLKEGRKALAAGNFDVAQDLARQAEATNPSGKWGLFDDTPAALLKDVQAARAKAEKAQAEQLARQAKDLLRKPAANDAERAYNLDSALQMARRADQLHGPYSAWEFGDRPDKLVKEIETARGKLKGLPTPPAMASNTGNPGATGQPFAATLPPAGPAAGPNTGVRPAVGTAAPGAPGGVVNAGGPAPGAPAMTAGGPKAPTGAPAAPVDAKKAAAVKLMGEGRQLADKGNFAGAKAKYVEAGRLGATFGPGEPDPGFAMQELSARGAAAINRLIGEANGQMAKKDFARAEAALNAASDIAAALSLFPRPVDEAKSALRLASGGKHGGVPPGGLSPVAGPEVLVPTGGPPTGPAGAAARAPLPGPVMPASPPGYASVGGPPASAPAPKPVAGAPAGGNVTGRQLLDQAVVEFRKGDFDVARRLALQAHNLGGSQDEARALLNQIDAEVFAAKQRTAAKSFEAAVEAAQHKDHGHALGVLVLIDPNLLPTDLRARREELITACKAELDRTGTPAPGSAVVAAAGTQPETTPPTIPPAGELQPVPGMPPAGANPPGTARVGSDPKAANPDSLTNQVDAMRKVTFQKLRSEGLRVQADAQAAFGRGDTDVAIQMLLDHANRVRAANLEPASVALLLRPIDSRLEMFRVMKGQADALAREKKEKREAKELITGRGAADVQRTQEVARLVREYHRLAKEGKYDDAERVALQAKQLDPDNDAVAALAHMAKMTRRVKERDQLKSETEAFRYGAWQDAEKQGPLVTIDDPVAVKLEAANRYRRRGSGDDAYLRSRTPNEFEIELKLDKPISVEFNQTPLDQVLDNIRTLTGIPLVPDLDSLEKEGLSTVKPITVRPGAAVSARNVLHIVLEQAGMSFVIEHDVVKVTSLKKAKGRLFTKVFSVADLVTPVPNYALPDYANVDKMLSRNQAGNLIAPGLTGTAPVAPPNGLQGGVPAGLGLGPNSPTGISGGTPFGGAGGTLQNQNAPNPLAASASLAPATNTKQEQLIKLVTSMVRPYSWDGMGGPGKVEYFDMGSALVVNQTADVIREVADLLEALRRLQDLAIAVEIRIVSLSETWFERMGVDFAMNVKTNTAKFEPGLTSGIFRPEPFVNDINAKGVTVGITPAGAGGSGGAHPKPNFTQDLDVPFRATSFNYAIPGFGGYPNNPGFNGGVSLGLAFLNDIQVYMFMEAAQGDRRINVMQAPKLTLFNGQTATMTVSETQYLVTSVLVFSVNGQIVFVPQNTGVPGPGDPLQGGSISITVQGVVSADRRFVRLNLPITLAAQTGATVPLFPITTFITPVFEGGSQGVPIPFTQFLQQPSFTTLNVNTTVICPDGGTVLMGGLKALSEGRNEFGPPFLSKIPYLNRLFKNVGIGRETRHVMIMVTPRIIINAEEEIFQTEGRGALGVGGPVGP